MGKEANLLQGAGFPDLDLPDHTGRPRTLSEVAGGDPVALTIHRAYNGYWFWGRATMEELRQDMRAITRELRDDWEVPAA